jgi:hypothetical protein
MSERIRHFSIYRNGRKVATASGNSYDIASNDEAQIADEGYLGHSDGATTTRLSTDLIVPVRRTAMQQLLEDMMAKKYIDIGLGILGGSVHKVKMRAVTCNHTGAAANGSLTGRFEFEGGVPDIVS